MTSAVIVAAGRGTRMGVAENKIFMELKGKLVIEHTIDAFLKSSVDEIIISASTDEIDRMHEICKQIQVESEKRIKITAGGKTRQESVMNALRKADGDVVCIHDGARCLITPMLIDKVIDDALKYGAAALGVKCKDTMKLADEDGYILSTIDRERLYMIQTPQVFSLEKLLRFHERAADNGLSVTDDCSLFEHYGEKVYITDGSYENLKLTTPEDLITAGEIIKRRLTNA